MIDLVNDKVKIQYTRNCHDDLGMHNKEDVLLVTPEKAKEYFAYKWAKPYVKLPKKAVELVNPAHDASAPAPFNQPSKGNPPAAGSPGDAPAAGSADEAPADSTGDQVDQDASPADDIEGDQNIETPADDIEGDQNIETPADDAPGTGG